MTAANGCECKPPSPRRRDQNRLWICPRCTQAWVAVRWENYAGDGLEWRRWEQAAAAERRANDALNGLTMAAGELERERQRANGLADALRAIAAAEKRGSTSGHLGDIARAALGGDEASQHVEVAHKADDAELVDALSEIDRYEDGTKGVEHCSNIARAALDRHTHQDKAVT